MASYSALSISVECVDNVFGVPGVVIYDDNTFPIPSQFSVECVDDPVGVDGVVVYDDTMFTISSKQGTAVGAGLHPHSSGRPFQSSTYEETLSDPPQASVEEEEVDVAALLRTLKIEEAEDLLD